MDITSKNIRNVVLLGHAGSGKTSFVENMLLEADAINRLGSISQENTVSDYTFIERDKKYSIFTSTMHIFWKDSKINIIDTPGADDLIGEVVSGLRVADFGLMLLNARYGVEVGTELIMEYVDTFNTPLAFVINHMDDSRADFENTLIQLKERFGGKVQPLQYPLEVGADFHSIVDVLQMVMYVFPPEGGRPQKVDIPESEIEKAKSWHNTLVEIAAENDEGLMERYFEKGKLSEEELRKGLNIALSLGDFYPVFVASAAYNMGSGRIMGFINDIAPAPTERPSEKLTDGSSLICSPDGDTSILIYKTISEPNVGNVSYFKVYSGVLSRGDQLFNVQQNMSENFSHIYVSNGKERTEVARIIAGDIGVTTKLKNSHTNNTLHIQPKETAIQGIHFPAPRYSMAIAQESDSELDKVAKALHVIQEEDPTLVIEQSVELNQTILHGQGQLHLDIIKYRLEKSFGVHLVLETPRIAYRETISIAVEERYRHKKQSGGSGQFAEVSMRIEPLFADMGLPQDLNVRQEDVVELPWGGTLRYLWCVVGGNIDTRFSNAIKKGIILRMENGPLTGAKCIDIQVSVMDGKMHSVDSNDMAFQLAAGQAFKQGVLRAKPKLLEPIMELEVLCQSDIMGEIMGDLQTKRGIITGMESEGHYQKIKANIPLAELADYSNTLRSLSQGKAKFSTKMKGYFEVPYEIQQSLLQTVDAESQ